QRAVGAGQTDLVRARAGRTADDAVGQRLAVNVVGRQIPRQAKRGRAGGLVHFGNRAVGRIDQGRRVVRTGNVDRVGLRHQRVVAVGDRNREGRARVLAVIETLDRRRVRGEGVRARDGVDRQRAVGAGQTDLVRARAGRTADDAVGQRLA